MEITRNPLLSWLCFKINGQILLQLHEEKNVASKNYAVIYTSRLEIGAEGCAVGWKPVCGRERDLSTLKSDNRGKFGGRPKT